jgi:hypothetical protein
MAHNLTSWLDLPDSLDPIIEKVFLQARFPAAIRACKPVPETQQW